MAPMTWMPAWLEGVVERERERLVLWLPVFVGIGCGWYLSLSAEPSPWPALAVLIGALASAMLLRHHMLAAGGAAVIAAVALGFALGCWRTDRMAAPILEKPLTGVAVSGRVAAIQTTETGRRLVLDRLAIAELAPAAMPAAIRLSVRQLPAGLSIGDRVAVRARLLPPPPPVAPGAFDFQRFLYFARIGATGQAFGTPVIQAKSDESFDLVMARLREAIGRRIAESLAGDTGAIATALVNGDQTGISPETMKEMRDSGLAHLLSISGLHIGLVAGFVLAAVRGFLALVPPLALRLSTRKLAAGAALVAIAGYTLLAGTDNVPVVRSFVMGGLVLLAIMADRNPFSLRLVAASVLVVLVVAPEALAGPSFQMSFAAVTALIAGYEVLREPMARWRSGGGLPARAGLWLGGMVYTSVLATVATAPFSAYHFQTVAILGLFANLAAIPISGLVVMPAAVIGLLLVPLGLDGFAFAVMGWGIELIQVVAGAVAAWPGAVLRVPAIPPAALALLALGGLWLCLWRTGWRLLGLAPILAGVLIALAAPVPDLLIAPEGGLMAVRQGDALYLSRASPSRLVLENWQGRLGARLAGRFAQAPDTACDAQGCLWKADWGNVSFPRSAGALAEDCGTARLIVADLYAGRACRAPGGLFVDRARLHGVGAIAIYLDGPVARVVSDRDLRGQRPWIPRWPDQGLPQRQAGTGPALVRAGMPASSGAAAPQDDLEP